MAEPLTLMGASQETVAVSFAATAVTLIGTDGEAIIAASEEAVEGEEDNEENNDDNNETIGVPMEEDN